MKWLQSLSPCLIGLCLLVCSVQLLHGQDSDDDDEEASVEEEPSEASFTEPVVENIVYKTPVPPFPFHLLETFDDADKFQHKWIKSSARKEDTDEEIAKYNGRWTVEPSLTEHLDGDMGLVLKDKAKHHAICAKLERPFHFEDKPLVLQYEVNFQNGQDCGGAYLKLITDSSDLDLAEFHDKTPYTIMFGPDKCGNDHKIHFIFRHKNPINGTVSEKHSKPTEGKIDDHFKDKMSHLYTLLLKPDNTYEIFVDQFSVNKGDLLEDFTPPVNPPSEIDDPYDRKPDDWDEREKIPDPSAKKPADWDEDAPRQIADPHAKKPEDWLDDEPDMLPDPNAEKPNDWDDEMDGEWEPPLISNPKCEKVGCGVWKAPMIDNPSYKGKWRPPMVANPNYKGKWKPRKVSNPGFFEDVAPFRMLSVGAVGFELWSMSDGILFDNILITNDKQAADLIASQTWSLKRRKSTRDAEGMFKRLINYTNNNPWLWAVYMVVIGLPLVLIFVFCCSSEDKDDRNKNSKKTDAVTPDDDFHHVPAPQPTRTYEASHEEKKVVPESRPEEIPKPAPPKPAPVEEKVVKEPSPQKVTVKEQQQKEEKENEENEAEEEEEEVEEEEEEVEEEEEEEEQEEEEEEEVVVVSSKEQKEKADQADNHDGSGDVDRSPRRRKPRRE